MGYRYVHSKTHEIWSLHGKMQILDLGYDFFLFKFDDPDDYKHVLLDGPWFICGRYLALRRWNTNFKPSEASINKTVVWGRAPELSLEYYDKVVLTDIANRIGRFIEGYNTSELVLRGKFARFCVYQSPLISL